MGVILSRLEKFIKFEATAGIFLLISALVAIMLANSELSYLYYEFIHIPIKFQLGYYALSSSVEHLVNDGLMAIFFLVVSLEIKKEMLEGHLSSPDQRNLPLIAAIAGVIVPAVIFIFFNKGNIIDGVSTTNGWAIPTATDIAFALGVLALFGRRVPVALKVFLMALAIIDDLIAILIIAIFYNHELSAIALLSALAIIMVLGMLNVSGVAKKTPYLCFGFILWVCVFNSGLHATLAGVVLGLFVPLNVKNKPKCSPLKEMDKELHYLVGFFIVPLFAFVNSGISLKGVSVAGLLSDPVALGIMVGLLLGKQLGIFGTIYLLIKSGISKMPKNSNWGQIYGISLLTGIGFTMSIFVGNLAFPNSEILINSSKIGVIFGSGLSAVIGYIVLQITCSKTPIEEEANTEDMLVSKVDDTAIQAEAIDEQIDLSVMSPAEHKVFKAVVKAEKVAIKIKEKAEAKAKKVAIKQEKATLEKEIKKILKEEKKVAKKSKLRAIKVEKSELKRQQKRVLKSEKRALMQAQTQQKEEEKAKERLRIKAAKETKKIVERTRKEEVRVTEKLGQAKRLAKAAEEIKLRSAKKMQEQSKKRKGKSSKVSTLSERLQLLKTFSETRKIASLEKKANNEIIQAERIAKAAQKLELAKTSLLTKRIANFEEKIAAKRNKKSKKKTSLKHKAENDGNTSGGGDNANNKLIELRNYMNKLKKEADKKTQFKDAKNTRGSKKPKASA
ncbi:MAG: Na+/H+ antiporter NhaA [Rickettsiales bacterium]|jgi:Na+:H+ antiporter, NhaA family|nr:Na+/H+ antiporter NhaA [Rickettsiales bacterium]